MTKNIHIIFFVILNILYQLTQKAIWYIDTQESEDSIRTSK